MRFLLLAFLFCLQATSILFAQPNRNGVPIVTNYPHAITKGSEQNWCITQDARGIIYVGNNDKGVLEYDGVEWRRIPIPKDPMVLSLVSGDDGVVYVGADSEFGFLAPDRLGDLQYRSISDTLDQDIYSFSGIRRSYAHQGKVYFCSFEHLLLQIRADQMPIGISEKELPFQATVFKDEGFNIYMFSDGFVDQLGGPAGKKYISKNFKKLILELQSVPQKIRVQPWKKRWRTGWAISARSTTSW